MSSTMGPCMSEPAEAKVAPELEKKLETCDADDLLRVIGVIRPPPEGADEAQPDAPPQSRTEYRRALLRAQEGVRAANTEVLQQVRRLGLEPRGGEVTGVFAVEASKDAVMRLLELDEIASLSLDQEIRLKQPFKSA